ncbi:MAG: hypothetical protein Q9217_002431 [Psora testacea]
MAEVDIAPRFGAELHDGFKPVNAWVSNGIGWLEEQQSFYRERAMIEKEYSTKLSALAKKYFEKKARRSTNLSVGDSPSITPGSLESASLTTWTTQLSTLEARAAEHDKYSAELQLQIADPLKTLAARYEELRKSHAEYAARLERERDISYGDLKKTKGRYDGACQEVENRRKKAESSFDHGKSKAQNAYQQQLLEMRNVKNTYLITINVTNKQKEKYYHEYVPELLDSLQDLAETRVQQLNSLWTHANNLEASALARSNDHLRHLGSEIPRNEPYLDSMMFLRHNVTQWQEPPDIVFEPSPVWLDDSTMAVDETAKVFLRNVLGKTKVQLRELNQEVDKKRREVDNVKRIRQSIREGKDKRDEVELVKTMFSMQEDLHQVERQRLTAEVETQTIISTVGDVSLGAQNHRFKSETFKIPTNCDLCGERIWGLSAKGFDCQDCGYTCHSKCELKVPAECPGEQSKEERKKLKAERQASSKAMPPAPNGAPPSHVTELPDLSRSKTMDTLSSGYAASASRSISGRLPDGDMPSERITEEEPVKSKPAVAARRNRIIAPPPTHYVSEAPTDSSSGGRTSRTSNPSEPRGKMLYAYQARNEGELSVEEGDDIVIAEPDDGSGWTGVRHANNSGLVPTTYLEVLPIPPSTAASADRPVSSYSSSSVSLTGSTQSGAPTTSSSTSTTMGKKKGPAVAPKRGAKKLKYVEAMYDYEARSEGEWSMNEGERFVLVNRDTGDGWADVERSGIVRSVPANYIHDVISRGLAMEEKVQKEGLLALRAASTSKLIEQPYNLREYLVRARYHEVLGYPDLAAGDAYKALLLTDEVEFGEFHEEVRESLWSNRERLDNFGSAVDQGHQDVGAWFGSVAKESAKEAYIILIQALTQCGDFRSAFDFAERGRKAWPNEEQLRELRGGILERQYREKPRQRTTRDQSVFSPKTDLPENGSVRREIYAWNKHEPDRFSEDSISFLNTEMRKCAPACEVLAVDLPLLGDDKEHDSELANRANGSHVQMVKQLGIFATEDIPSNATVLLEPSILTANNRLLDPLCDACSAPLPPISPASPVPTCADCDDICFCSETCLDRALQTYHPAICGSEDFDMVAKDPSPAAATDALYVLLLARVIAMAETQGAHPLDLPETKYLWGDFTPSSAPIERKLPFNFQTNITHPIHILIRMGLNPFAPTTVERYDMWVLNTLFAKFRGVASAKMNPYTLRPDVAAVHSLWSLANHSCAPNVRWEWGAEDGNLRGGEKGAMGFVARGGKDVVQWGDGQSRRPREGGIKKGEEVLNHYCDVGMDVRERREWAVGALGGICRCERCVWEEKEEKNKRI